MSCDGMDFAEKLYVAQDAIRPGKEGLSIEEMRRLVAYIDPHPWKIFDSTTWHDVVVQCEKILGCDDTAASPFMSNLPNLIRDLKSKLADVVRHTE